MTSLHGGREAVDIETIYFLGKKKKKKKAPCLPPAFCTIRQRRALPYSKEETGGIPLDHDIRAYGRTRAASSFSSRRQWRQRRRLTHLICHRERERINFNRAEPIKWLVHAGTRSEPQNTALAFTPM